jgi:hypothetical protein
VGLYLKTATFLYFCHLKNVVSPETFGHTLLHRCGWFGGVAAHMRTDTNGNATLTVDDDPSEVPYFANIKSLFEFYRIVL